MINLALHKPSSQSSVTTWPTDTARQNTGYANDGNTACEYGLHTNVEKDPWWQVDLGEEFVINRIVLFNRYHFAERLANFTLLKSSNGEDWVELFRKRDTSVFGQPDESPYVVALPGRDLARYIRLRLDGDSCLHFRELQVFGRQPEPALRDVLVHEAKQADIARSALPAGREGRIIPVDGFSVFADQANYHPAIIACFENESYEGRERELVKMFVRPGDRVLEIGTAAGLVSMTAASIAGAANVLTFDANPDIVADAQANYWRNGLGGVQSHHGILKNRQSLSGGPETIDFFISEAFWASRMDATLDSPDIIKKVSVPVLCLEDEIARHQATVLICDIEGGEVGLLTDADLDGIKLVIMETHYGFVGEAVTDAMIAKLVGAGLSLHLIHSGGGVVVMRRHAQAT